MWKLSYGQGSCDAVHCISYSFPNQDLVNLPAGLHSVGNFIF